MPAGHYPREYFATTAIEKPIEQIYADLNGFTNEHIEANAEAREWTCFTVVLPPLSCEGRFVKGLFFSQSVDVLLERHPRLSALFCSIAWSMSAAYPWSRSADAYFACYSNPHREAWFRRTCPERADKALLPFEAGDNVNEYVMSPMPGAQKDFDLCGVARLTDVKNLPMIARALKTYRAKYRRVRMALIVGKEFDVNYRGLDEHEIAELRKVESILIHPRDYIEFVPRANYGSELSAYYSRSKALVLASLVEGKNRSIDEAVSCNTPVVCFRAFNQFSRGESPAFPRGAGLYAPEFDAESLADTFHEAIENYGDLAPRGQWLKASGRRHFLNRCLNAIPYYWSAVPDFHNGPPLTNVWLDMATFDNYRVSLHDFIYDKRPELTVLRGFEAIDKTVEFYSSKFGVPR